MADEHSEDWLTREERSKGFSSKIAREIEHLNKNSLFVYDFLCSAVVKPELNDESQALNSLELDYSPVSVVHFHNVNKTQKEGKLLTILFDTEVIKCRAGRAQSLG